jgi:septal ring factor EnvC (AmiA/AmiB activator)
VTDPFESYERTIAGQKEYIRDMHVEKQKLTESLILGREEARRLRDACRQTNKGITRLRRRCDAQTKKIAELKAIVREAISLGVAPQHWPEAVEGRRPEKAT